MEGLALTGYVLLSATLLLCLSSLAVVAIRRRRRRSRRDNPSSTFNSEASDRRSSSSLSTFSGSVSLPPWSTDSSLNSNNSGCTWVYRSPLGLEGQEGPYRVPYVVDLGRGYFPQQQQQREQQQVKEPLSPAEGGGLPSYESIFGGDGHEAQGRRKDVF